MTSRDRDLPPKWNGQHVIWDAWAAEEPPARHRVPLDAPTCWKCGSTATPRSCSGVLEQPSRRFAVAWGRIYVSRCADCGLDTVYDPAMDAIWTLDESDYGPTGSVEPEAFAEALG